MSTTIITGGTGGIGSETALRILTESPQRHAALVDLHAADLPACLEPVADRVHCYSCDVTDPDSVATAYREIEKQCPAPDSLVAAAGIVHNSPSIDISVQELHRMLAVHVDGTLLWSQMLARALDGRPGSIVTLGSIAGQFGHPRRIAYAIAKASIHSMTKTLAVEWAPLNIRVNAVTPGYIQTPMMEEVTRIGLVDGDIAAGYAAMKRMGRPGEVADAIAFLLNSRSSFITGHILNVDGGFSVLKAE